MNLHTPHCGFSPPVGLHAHHLTEQTMNYKHFSSNQEYALTLDHRDGSKLAAAFVTPCNRMYWPAHTKMTLQQWQSVQLQWLHQHHHSIPVTTAVYRGPDSVSHNVRQSTQRRIYAAQGCADHALA